MTTDDSIYDAVFYRYQREGALRSARAAVPLLHDTLPIETVLDVGCGAGAWLTAHQESGVAEILGVDGDYIDTSLLVIDAALFVSQDIATPFNLGREFDLVECLEVGEHVPERASRILVENLISHGKVILFSAAVPGQGGKGHINEQPLEYWRRLFADRGYQTFDFIRPQIVNDRRIEWWYRYNTLLYVHESAVASLPKAVRDTALSPGAGAPDFTPLTIRLRKMVLRLIPAALVSKLAELKHRIIVRSLIHG